MIAVEYAKQPIYTNIEGTCILLHVKFIGANEEVLFSAMPDDSSEHGRQLFANAKAGMYGEVAPFQNDSLE